MSKKTKSPETTGTKVNNPSKDNKVANANLAKAGKDAVAEKAGRESKYAYPEACKSASEKKLFRRKARAAKSAFEKAITELKASKEPNAAKDLKTKEKEFAAFQETTYA